MFTITRYPTTILPVWYQERMGWVRRLDQSTMLRLAFHFEQAALAAHQAAAALRSLGNTHRTATTGKGTQDDSE